MTWLFSLKTPGNQIGMGSLHNENWLPLSKYQFLKIPLAVLKFRIGVI
uniref:Uncharacterized protein n=1 Tax=Anguilla anguilla TaxID=7936 RepID=A0A0E9UEP4_ANGAN